MTNAPGIVFDWDSFARTYTGQTLSSGSEMIEHIERHDFMYTKAAMKSIYKLSQDKNFLRKMNNFITFRILFHWMRHLSYEYNHLYRSYFTFLDGTKEFPDDWEKCLDLMAFDMPKALSALYVSQFYKSDRDESVRTMTNYIQKTLTAEIEQYTWMDEKTKIAGREKLANLVYKVGKPDTWVDNTAIAAEMARHYQGVSLSTTDHVANVKKLVPIRISEDRRKLNNELNPTDDWKLEMYDTHVEYNARWNEVIIPAGLIQEPLFAPGYPAYMNFGGLGTWIGIASVRAIGETGQVLDSNNNVVNWWTQKTWEDYDALKQTMIDFYNYTTPIGIVISFSNNFQI